MGIFKIHIAHSFYLKIVAIAISLHLSMALNSLGQAANYESLSLYDVTTKDFVPISKLMGEKGLVLIFTSSYCPFVEFYENRINSIIKDYTDQGITFVLVNSNNSIGKNIETVDQMRAESKRRGIKIISDQSHEIMNAFDASKTPEVVVLRIKNNQIEKSYQGAIDDSPKSESTVKNDYLRLVLNNLLVNKPSPVKDTRPAGCLIK